MANKVVDYLSKAGAFLEKAKDNLDCVGSCEATIGDDLAEQATELSLQIEAMLERITEINENVETYLEEQIIEE